jgi:hypothetical protein
MVKFRGDEISQDKVRSYWEITKHALSASGYDTEKVPMPNELRIFVNVPHRSFANFQKSCKNRDNDEYDGDYSNVVADASIYLGCQMTEHSEEQEPTLILVHKGAAHKKRSIFHELLHVYEYYLGLKCGSLARSTHQLALCEIEA